MAGAKRKPAKRKGDPWLWALAQLKDVLPLEMECCLKLQARLWVESMAAECRGVSVDRYLLSWIKEELDTRWHSEFSKDTE